MTSSWWLATSPWAAWKLVADAPGSLRWWRSVALAGPSGRDGAGDDSAFSWRALTGLRVRLCVVARVTEARELIEWQVHGDLRARASWVFAAVEPDGSEVTCRWEMTLSPAATIGLGLIERLLLERCHFARMRACAQGMAAALSCRGRPLREWSGSLRR